MITGDAEYAYAVIREASKFEKRAPYVKILYALYFLKKCTNDFSCSFNRNNKLFLGKANCILQELIEKGYIVSGTNYGLFSDFYRYVEIGIEKPTHELSFIQKAVLYHVLRTPHKQLIKAALEDFCNETK